MSALNLIPFFMIGLLGGVHCIGMCGGIVSAFSLAAGRSSGNSNALLKKNVFYNLGRISSYTIAGMMAGALAGDMRTWANVTAWQSSAYVLMNVMLIALALYLMDVWHGLTYLEKLGQFSWKKIKPLTRFFIPADTSCKLFLLGCVWGWLPCGMVYSVLLVAMLSSSAVQGASIMFAFGLGTLPMLLTMGLFGIHIRRFLQHRSVRFSSGFVVLMFGIVGLLRINADLPKWLGAFCVSPI